ncbi:MAG: YeeE/YedE family protein [Pseudomonadota bacterium]
MAARIEPGRPVQPLPMLVGTAALALFLAITGATVAPRQALLMLVAAGLGVVLYHGALGFTAYWRRWLLNREGRGVRIQLAIVALGTLAFFPLIGGWLPGFTAGGAVAPLALELVVGAFLFGVGMQLANGCGSGTLFTLGGGSTKMLLTLAAFVVGSLAATFHLHLWRTLPQLPAVSLVVEFGILGGWLAQASILGGVAVLVIRLERRPVPAPSPTGDILRGPWPPFAAAGALAVLAVAVFWLSGQPWGVTFAFALWGGQLFEALGGDLSGVPFWSAAWARGALDASPLQNTTSVTNIGVILGALIASSLAGRFDPPLVVPWRHALAAVLGGLLMGYGARLAYGCNIGAFLGGTMSGSLHGWLWLAAALVGAWLGVRLRPRFGLRNEPAEVG